MNRIAIVSIPVMDQARSRQFYVDVLGFEVLAESPMGPDRNWVQLGIKGSETSITLVTWFDAMAPGSVQGLVIDTQDIESERAALIERGLEISEIDKTPWGQFAMFSDPDNNGWVLQQSV